MMQQIYISSECVQARSLQSVHMMIDEELGELARAINRPARCDEPAFHELCDLMICLADMMWLIDGYTAVLHYNDNRFLPEINKWFKRAYPRDEYLAFQEVKKAVNAIDLDRDTSIVFQRCVDAMNECISLLRTFEPQRSYDEMVAYLRYVISLKCSKWRRVKA